jgi:hypothetical protein
MWIEFASALNLLIHYKNIFPVFWFDKMHLLEYLFKEPKISALVAPVWE